MENDPDKLDFVIGRYLDGRATDEQSAWLAARLGECSRDLDEMVEALLVEAELFQLAEEGDLIPGGRVGERWWLRPGWLSVFAAAAVLAIAGLVLSRIAAPTPEPFAEWTPSPGGVVSVSGGETGSRELSAGSTLRVTQGCSEVVLRDGVRCVVQAPGLLRLESGQRVHLEEGVARFRVEKQARGFEVLTDDLKVVDLGTEFGVDARGEGRGEVHVIQGLVEVSSLAGRRESMKVEAGGAVALGAVGRLESTLFKPGRFVDELPSGIPALHFDFEPSANGVFEADGALARRSDARITVEGPPSGMSVRGRNGKALQLGEDRFAVSNWPGIGGTSPRTVSFWIRLDRDSVDTAAAILGWGNFQDMEKMADFGIRTVGGSGKLRIVSGRRWLEGGRSIAGNGWHHVLVMLGEHRPGKWPEVRLFVDGEEDTLMSGEPWKHAKAPLDTFSTDIHNSFSQPLILGRFVAEGRQWLPGLRGALDDVIVAEGVLTADQVRAVYEGRLADSGLDLGE